MQLGGIESRTVRFSFIRGKLSYHYLYGLPNNAMSLIIAQVGNNPENGKARAPTKLKGLEKVLKIIRACR